MSLDKAISRNRRLAMSYEPQRSVTLNLPGFALPTTSLHNYLMVESIE
jgi:hypothetical protein